MENRREEDKTERMLMALKSRPGKAAWLVSGEDRDIAFKPVFGGKFAAQDTHGFIFGETAFQI